MADTFPLKLLLLAVSGWVHRHQQDTIAYLVEENRILKEQLGGKRPRLNDDQRRRLAALAKRLGRKTLNQVATIVTPDTLMRWYHRLIAAKWTFPAKKRVGRPGLMKAIAEVIVRFAIENPSWGYCRIQGELKDVGHTVASTTIANVLKANGIKPAPDRPASWKAFLRAHWGQIAVTDFFTTEVWTLGGLKTYYVLFVMDLKTRRVEIAGITTNREGFMAQIARNLTDVMDSFLKDHKYLICDRDSKFTEQFNSILKDSGVRIVFTPRQAPNCNAYAERFVLSIKSECLRKMAFFGENWFRKAVGTYVEHYHIEREHQGIGTAKLNGANPQSVGDVRCSERLGGILKNYYRAA